MLQLNNDRVRIKMNISFTARERVLQTATLIVFLWGIVYLMMQWSSLPATVPAHYDGNGEIDRWGSKWELFISPGIGLILYVGISILSRYPHLYNYPVKITEHNAANQYLLARTMIGWINLEMIGLFSYIEWSSVQAALGKSDGMSVWSIFIILIILLGTLGVYLVRSFRSK